MPNYVFLLWQDVSKGEQPGTPGFDEQMGRYGALQEELIKANAFKSGDPLVPGDAGQVVRVRDGRSETSRGGFATGPEQLIGYYALDCKDDADAAAWAAKIPAAATGAVEVRPVMSM
jgi:hypothetical protein